MSCTSLQQLYTPNKLCQYAQHRLPVTHLGDFAYNKRSLSQSARQALTVVQTGLMMVVEAGP